MLLSAPQWNGVHISTEQSVSRVASTQELPCLENVETKRGCYARDDIERVFSVWCVCVGFWVGGGPLLRVSYSISAALSVKMSKLLSMSYGVHAGLYGFTYFVMKYSWHLQSCGFSKKDYIVCWREESQLKCSFYTSLKRGGIDDALCITIGKEM